MQACRITATELACQRGERMLFAGLSFVLDAGEALQVQGSNGIGKSSLIRILAGLLSPIAGSAECVGALGLLDENPALDPHLPLGSALQFWQRLDGPADNAATRLGLGTLFDVPVRYLSTGQRKRAALARLIGQQAPIWLLDEPLNGLDMRGAALITEIVNEHCGNGGIAVIASHQPFALEGMQKLELSDYLPSPVGRDRGWGFSDGGVPQPHPLPTGEGHL